MKRTPRSFSSVSSGRNSSREAALEERRTDRQPFPHRCLDLVDSRGPHRDADLARPRYFIAGALITKRLRQTVWGISVLL
jgi:hypothetical protein